MQMQPDLDRMTKPEIWRAGLEAGRAEATAQEPGTPATDGGLFFGRSLTSTEFLVTAWTTAFSTWVGYHVIMNPELDLQRAGTAVAANVGVAWYYMNKRTEQKKDAAEAGTTTIKTPAGAVADAVTLARNGRLRT